MKILIDMNLSPEWAPLLSEAGFPAVHWSSIGAANAKDSLIMAYAEREGYAIFTEDLDFGDMLYAANAAKPSIIQIRSDFVLPEHIFSQVCEAIERNKDAIEQGALLTIDSKKHRVHILPLRS
jgi:predicted nuclease of predicted toxin-antitoxin system